MMFLIHIFTQPQEDSRPLILLCALRTLLCRLILLVNWIYMVVIIFLLFKKIVSLFDALPRWNLSRAEWVKFDILCKEKLTLDTIELYDEPIVLFNDI